MLSLSRIWNKLTSFRLHENEAAFDRYKILPRVLRNVDQIDMSIEILGSRVRTN